MIKNFFATKRKFILNHLEYYKVSLLRPENKTIVIVYDCFSSPPTYGDFSSTIFLSRHLSSMGFKTKIVIINSEYRDDWNEWITNRETVVNTFCLLSKQLTNYKVEVVKKTFTNFMTEIAENKSLFILFKRKILRRYSVYNNSFDFNNSLHLKNKSRDFLIKKNENFIVIHPKFQDLEYLSFHCRYNPTSDIRRNLSISNFYKIMEVINRISNLPLVIITDELGRNFYKNEISKIKNFAKFNIIFSKDYTNSYIEDASLAINSSGYIQFMGGGMALMPMFSHNTNYLIYDKAVNEQIKYQEDTACAWANQDIQIRRFSNNFDDFLSSLNIFLKKITD